MEKSPSALTNVLYTPKNQMDDFDVGLRHIIFERAFDTVVINSFLNIFTCLCIEMHRFTQNIHETLLSLNKDLILFLKYYEIISDENNVVFRFDLFTNQVKFYDIKPLSNSPFNCYKVKLSFSSSMIKLLGVTKENYIAQIKEFIVLL